MPPRGAAAGSNASAPTGLQVQEAVRADVKKLVDSGLAAALAANCAECVPGGIYGVALMELLAGSVAALESRHAGVVFSLIIRGRLPAHPPPPFTSARTRGGFPAGDAGDRAFKCAAFRFVQAEVAGEGPAAGGRARMTVAAAQQFVQACVATLGY